MVHAHRDLTAVEHHPDRLAYRRGVLELADGAAFFKGSAIERCYRDIRAAKLHPFTPEQTLIHGGRLALGLSVDEV